MRNRHHNPTILGEVRPVPRDGNPMWPLPPDYAQLTEDGQRLARVNACSLRETPDDFVGAWSFFRATYLEPLPPGVFYKRLLPSPPAHYRMIRDMAEYGRNIHAAPRGSAKSTVIGTEAPLLLGLTRPYSVGLLTLAIHPMVELRFSTFQRMLTENEYIVRDFGEMKPARQDGRKWSLTNLQLTNGSMIYGTSVDGRKRGGRPDYIILDDPEYDPAHPGQETRLRDQLDSLLFHQLLPMLDSDEQIFEWVGTLINCRSALYQAVNGGDPRFDFFNRRLYSAVHTPQTPEGQPEPSAARKLYFWPQKWDDAALALRRREIGDAAFEAEYQNNPISDKERAFRLDDHLDMYEVHGEEVRYWGPDGAPHTLKLLDWLSGLARLMTVDLLHVASATSDFSGALTVGVDSGGAWWLLDLFLGRVSGERLMSEIWRAGSVNRVRLVAVESAAGQDYFRQWVEARKDPSSGPLPWSPDAVWPIRYPHGMSKEERISGLIPRFAAHRCKLPAHLRHLWPWTEFFKEVSYWTPDGLSLAHDDGLDLLSMVNYCPKITPQGFVGPDAGTDLLQQLMNGNVYDDRTGLPIAAALDISRIPQQVLGIFLDKRRQADYNKSESPRRSRMSSLQRPRHGSMYTPVGPRGESSRTDKVL